MKSYKIIGFFEHGPIKWLLTEIQGDLLIGIDILNTGYVHTLHINISQVRNLTLIKE